MISLYILTSVISFLAGIGITLAAVLYTQSRDIRRHSPKPISREKKEKFFNQIIEN